MCTRKKKVNLPSNYKWIGYNDDGHYYVVTSPNIGMVTQGGPLEDAVYWTEDAMEPC